MGEGGEGGEGGVMGGVVGLWLYLPVAVSGASL